MTNIAVRVKASSAGQVQLFWGRVGADAFVIASAQSQPAGGISITLAGKIGRTYDLQHTDAIVAPAWTNAASFGPLVTNQSVTLSSGILSRRGSQLRR